MHDLLQPNLYEYSVLLSIYTVFKKAASRFSVETAFFLEKSLQKVLLADCVGRNIVLIFSAL